MNIQQARCLVEGQTVFYPIFSHKVFTVDSINDKEEHINNRYFKEITITEGSNKYIVSSLSLELCPK